MERLQARRLATTSARDVEADIRAELASHLALCEDELIAEGCSLEHAKELARLRFGNFERTARACRNQKLRGTMMLQRIHWIATACLSAAVIWFGLQAHSNARIVAALKSDAFAATALPLELEPVVIQRGDSIELQDAYNGAALNRTVELASDGTALFPELGHVMLAGMMRDEAEALLMERYSSYYDLLDLHIRVIKAR